MGLWDMEEGPRIRRLAGWDESPASDQLVLARLHREPLAILHIDVAPGEETDTQLIDAVWDQAHDALRAHVRAHGCLTLPTDPGALEASLTDPGALEAALTDPGALEAALTDPGVPSAALTGPGVGGHGCPGRLPPRPPGHAAVIVCTIGRGAELARCIGSLCAMTCEDFEIVVVDNRPSDPRIKSQIEDIASNTTTPVRYVAESRVGSSAARNSGVATVPDAAYVAFTDDDVEVDPEWLGWLLSPFTGQNVQAVTGLVLPLTLASAVQKRFERYAGFGKGVRREVYDMGEHRARDRFLFPYWGGMFGSGNSMAFRRDALLAVGGFDPALGPGTPTHGGEDIAAFSDVVLGGGAIVYEPRSLCWHEHRGDEQALRDQVRNYGIGLTAVLWRYLCRDWRFTASAVRSLPLVLRLARSRSADRQDDRLPADLAKLEARGRLRGPWRYIVSRRRARRA
jgi:GT2 family glycosyltransferase